MDTSTLIDPFLLKFHVNFDGYITSNLQKWQKLLHALRLFLKYYITELNKTMSVKLSFSLDVPQHPKEWHPRVKAPILAKHIARVSWVLALVSLVVFGDVPQQVFLKPKKCHESCAFYFSGGFFYKENGQESQENTASL